MYIINSPKLIPAVQKLWKTVSFAAIEAQTAASIFLCSKEANEIIGRGLMDADSYTGTFTAAIHPALKPGANLDDMNRAAIRTIATSLDRLQAGGSIETNLFDLVRDEIILATSDAVYGPHNPFRDPEVLRAWHQFEPQLITFAINLFPRLLAPAAFKARQRVTDSFVAYIRAGHHKQGSALVQARHTHSSSFGLTPDDIGGAEVGGAFAVLGSTAPAAFWLIYHLFSSPVLLEECRAEVAALVVEEEEEQEGVSTIDVTAIKSKCPVLLATFQEVLRYRHISVSARVVLKEDEMLDGKYRLKKDSMLMIPVTVIHTDPDSWGASASVFDHRRFLPENIKAIPRTAYRPFGGGYVFCPGRHFATTEILAFAALIMLRFDITPAAAGGKWRDVTIDKTPLTPALAVPDDPIRVHIRPREPSRKWRVELVESDRAVGIVAEDISSSM
ncbi:hypothetical protein N0V82_008481 [Gnomoniopsis sp. IMI 355080]|nr:hypothetical protein N0V82_008481 [Gnomoniopsis sp. IMI 355080]